MPRVSATIITLNEAENIRDCIESVLWADEVVVVDSGSTDGTVEIAREYTDRVLNHDWPGHVQQKNYAIDQAQADWIFSLDADERVTPELAEDIKRVLLSETPEYRAYSVPRLAFYLGRYIRHCGWYPDRKVRLFAKDAGRWGGRNPHDSVKVGCPVGALRGDLIHYTYRDISHNMRTVNSFSSIAAAEMRSEGERAGAFDLTLRPCWDFFREYVVKGGFLDGRAGLVISAMTAYSVFCKYAKLWELARGAGAGDEAGE